MILLTLVCNILLLYTLAIIGVAVLSFVRVTPGSGVAQLQGMLRRATDPLILPVRRAMSGVTGSMPIDFSPIIVILGINLIRSALC